MEVETVKDMVALGDNEGDWDRDGVREGDREDDAVGVNTVVPEANKEDDSDRDGETDMVVEKDCEVVMVEVETRVEVPCSVREREGLGELEAVGEGVKDTFPDWVTITLAVHR